MTMSEKRSWLDPPPAFVAACERMGLTIPTEPCAKLQRFLHLLLAANEEFNLTAIRSAEEAWMRHLLDSLSLLPFLGTAGVVIDVGSGGGLPGVPLAILSPERCFVLLEATGKKADFLRRAAVELELPKVSVVHERAEKAGHQDLHREQYDLALSRAVALLPTLLEYTLPFVRVGGRALAMKGASVGPEIAKARRALELLGGGGLKVHAALPGIVEDAVLVETWKERPTPGLYPRAPGVPAKKPL